MNLPKSLWNGNDNYRPWKAREFLRDLNYPELYRHEYLGEPVEKEDCNNCQRNKHHPCNIPVVLGEDGVCLKYKRER